MEQWIIKHLQELLAAESIAAEDIDDHLVALRGHSLKMVTFLARFAREFGGAPKIMDFLERPCLATLSAAQPVTQS
ncbi:acyl carrier protein [Chromobacterium phragmitis]|uniref:Acyl carrier protein n=1 Tax=Chromobacterium phragmitis TaxID=2202141 RepID=A0ABV0IZF2_9NEIS|nr:acyl carrier protein [Chromobacterium phragmitis]